MSLLRLPRRFAPLALPGANSLAFRWRAALFLPAIFLVAGCDRPPTSPNRVTRPSFAIVPGGGSWAVKAPMPTARTGVATGVVNGQLYAVGGSLAYEAPRTVNEAYDPSTNTWATKAPAPTSRAMAEAGAIAGKLYVVGGCITSDCRIGTTNVLEIYDPITNTWTTGAPMATARSTFALGVIGGRLYAAGGNGPCPPCAAVSTLEIYDPLTNSWSAGAPMPTPRGNQLQGAVAGGKFYVVSTDASLAEVPILDAYDPVTNTWALRTPMSIPRVAYGVVEAGGIIYAISGILPTGTPTNAVEAYDPATDNWTTVAPISTARYLSEPQSIGGIVYAVGSGWYPFAISANEAFTIAPPTVAPIAHAGGPYTGSEGATMSLNGTASSDPGGAALTYSWNFGDGSPSGSSAAPSHVYADNGTYTVSLTVANPSGATNTATTTATVANVAPSVSLINGGTILKGETFTGSGFFADPGLDTWTATVNYGDGSGTSVLPLSGKTFQLIHVYRTPGSYLVVVTVTDDDGAAGVGQATVTVNSSQQEIRELVKRITNLVTAGVLSPGNGNALSAKLQAAIGQLDRGNTTAATNQLNAFINDVNALVRAGRLPAVSGQGLIDAANRIITAVNTP